MLKLALRNVLALGVLIAASSAQAFSVDWSGAYRLEWVQVNKPSLGTPSDQKAYGLNHLYLRPKIIAFDGVNIYSKFHLLNSNQYKYSQLGDIWGRGEAGLNSGNQGTSDISVSQLYLTVNQEYGALIVGRAPYDFGLGMTYSSGEGMFDHWYNTRDIIGYKVVIGNWFLMPSIGRKNVSGYNQNGTVTLIGAQLQYENPETRSLLGIYQENVRGRGNDGNYTNDQVEAYGGTGATRTDSLKIQKTNFVFGRGFDSFSFKFEAGFQSGEVGVQTATGKEVSVNGYGIAAEFEVPGKEDSKWDYTFKLGMATGYNGSEASYGAYAFNPNYDVGMLLFNQRLGNFDIFNTNVIKNGATSVSQTADDEMISNVAYIAPSVNYSFTDKWSLRNTVVYAQLLETQKNSVDSTKDLGLEWDIDLVYKHSKKIQWVNQVGLLFPGDAWKNGTGTDGNYSNSFTYGFTSKAAISF